MWSWEFSGRHALQVPTHPCRLAIVRINKLISSLEDQSLVASLQGQGSVHISALSLSSLTICFFTFFFRPPRFHTWPSALSHLATITFTFISGHLYSYFYLYPLSLSSSATFGTFTRWTPSWNFCHQVIFSSVTFLQNFEWSFVVNVGCCWQRWSVHLQLARSWKGHKFTCLRVLTSGDTLWQDNSQLIDTPLIVLARSTGPEQSQSIRTTQLNKKDNYRRQNQIQAWFFNS